MNIEKPKIWGILFFLVLIFLLVPKMVEAKEYKPLVLDLPAESQNEAGTVTYVIKRAIPFIVSVAGITVTRS